MNLGRKQARELIAFYRDAGADALLGEAPVDRMADEAPPPPPERGRTDGEAVAMGVSAPAPHQRTDSPPDRPSLDRQRRSAPPLPGEGKAIAPTSPDAAA